jgi:hypothetical protein
MIYLILQKKYLIIKVEFTVNDRECWIQDYSQIAERLIHYELIKDDRRYDLILILIFLHHIIRFFLHSRRINQLDLNRKNSFIGYFMFRNFYLIYFYDRIIEA